MRWSILVALVLMAVAPIWAQSPSASPASRPNLAVLIVTDHSDPSMASMEQALTDSVKREREAHGISSSSLPIIYFHVDKPAEKKYCEVKLHVYASDLPYAGVVEQDNYVVKNVLYQAQNVQVADDAAGRLVLEAADMLRSQVIGLPDAASPSPVSSADADTLRQAFRTYRSDISSLSDKESHMTQQYQQALVEQRSGHLSTAAFLEVLNKQLIPQAQDLGAATQRVTLDSPEVLHLHQSYIEACSYALKQFEALADGTAQQNQTLLHLADSYAQLSASSMSRWQLEYQALEQKYR